MVYLGLVINIFDTAVRLNDVYWSTTICFLIDKTSDKLGISELICRPTVSERNESDCSNMRLPQGGVRNRAIMVGHLFSSDCHYKNVLTNNLFQNSMKLCVHGAMSADNSCADVSVPLRNLLNSVQCVRDRVKGSYVNGVTSFLYRYVYHLDSLLQSRAM